MKDLVGRKVKGFKFDVKRLHYSHYMDECIGKIGVIIGVDVYDSDAEVKFEDGKTWAYPLNQIEEHLVPEREIGKEYEFSDDGQVWTEPTKLLAIIDHEYKYLVVGGHDAVFEGYKQIREIKPKVKELTLEEAEEKFGCDVNEIKIKK